jgi:signal transduction histidine kinase
MVMRSQAEVSLKSKKYKTWLETTLTHVDQMNRLIDTLLQLENKHAAWLLLDDCSITPLLTSLTDQTATKYKDKNINLTLTTSPNLVKKTHRWSLEIILRNLIDNAYKYTPEDGTIIITADTHKLIVSDSGLWIPADQLARIREPFWQADSSKWQDHGLGLWLTLVHSLVQQLGWAIDVVSSDKWTTFTLHFAD